MKALIVEDEKLLADALKRLFKSNGIDADLAYEGSTGNTLALNGKYDIIILDIMIPGDYNGLEILENIRSRQMQTPVLMLTARDSLQDKVTGLNHGADDYLVKPFEADELVARVNALTRRFQYKNKTQSIKILRETSELIIDDKQIQLTQKELKLLEYLMNSKGRPRSKRDILREVWGKDKGITDNSVELYIHYLRKKLKDTRLVIKTIRNQGYRLTVKNDGL